MDAQLLEVADDYARVLAGDIGEFIVIARRNIGWSVGAMTNEAARAVEIPLDFLGTGQFIARIYADDETPSALAITERTVDRRDTIELRLAPSGGGAIEFSAVR